MESKVRVWKGKASQVEASFAKDAYLTLPRAMTASLDKSVELNEPLMAPINQGDVIGKVVWKNNDETVASYPLISNQTVEQASWFGQIWDSIVLWVKSFF